MGKRFTPAQKERAVKLYKMGVSLRQINELTGIPTSTVSYLARTAGVQSRNAPKGEGGKTPAPCRKVTLVTCSHCGQKSVSDANFCWNCGEKLASARLMMAIEKLNNVIMDMLDKELSGEEE